MAVCVAAGWVAPEPVCLGRGVGEWDADGVGDPDDGREADGVPDVLAVADTDTDARADVLLAPGDVALDPAEALLEDPCPVGDGVRVPGWVDDVADVPGFGV